MTQAAIFRERLWPGWGAAGAALGMAASLAIAYSAAYGHGIGWLTFACSCAAMTVIAIPASPVTTVTSSTLSVGRAKIEKGFLGQAGVISPARLRELRRDRSLHNAFWAVPIGSRMAVAVAINDDEDPHPMWIIGSRRPDDLLNALHKVGE